VIWVWSATAKSTSVSVKIQLAKVQHVDAPTFTVCPDPSGTTCTLGSLPTGQADELKADAKVLHAASAGEKVKLTATAKGKTSNSDQGSDTLTVTTATTPSTTPTTSPTVPAGTLPAEPLPPIPGVSSAPGVPDGLFPTVTPAPTGGASSGIGSATFPPVKKHAERASATTDSATLPLSPRLIGGQLLGLAVLAGAVAIAVTRLSLRRARPKDASAGQEPAAKT
jgi:hypothetical protein